jgi:transcription antitermination factor NusG
MDDIIAKNRSWYAYYVKPRHEIKAAIQLESIGLLIFLPSITIRKRWSDRWKNITEPLFKGYIFVYADEKERLMGLQQKAVINTVSFAGKPAKIPEAQIENIKKMLSTDADVFVTDKIVIGSVVVIKDGPFKGIEGIVYSSVNNEKMLAVTIDLLHRSVIVKLPVEEIINKNI